MVTLAGSIDQTLNEQAFQFARNKLPVSQFLYRAKTKKDAYDDIFNAIKHHSSRKKIIIITDLIDLAEINDDKF